MVFLNSNNINLFFFRHILKVIILLIFVCFIYKNIILKICTEFRLFFNFYKFYFSFNQNYLN